MKTKSTNNYLKVGEQMQCGNCHPEKVYLDCKKLPVPCECICHQPQECKHKNPIPCNTNSCDGVEFVHYFHCENCGIALKPQEKLEDWVEKFEKIVSRMCADFPIDRVDWNKRVAPYLRELHDILTQSKQETREEIEGIIKKIKEPRMSEKDFENVPNKRGIWHGGYAQALSDILKLL